MLLDFQKKIRFSLIRSLYKYPRFTTYILHSFHGQSFGLKFFILFLKTAREADFFISFGTCDLIFGPRYFAAFKNSFST